MNLKKLELAWKQKPQNPVLAEWHHNENPDLHTQHILLKEQRELNPK